MNDQLALIVSLRVEKSSRNLLRDSLIELFVSIQKEPTFLNATVYEDIDDPEQLLVHEVWHETRETFLANQMSKPYRANYEKLILDLHVDRTPHLLQPVGSLSSSGQAQGC